MPSGAGLYRCASTVRPGAQLRVQHMHVGVVRRRHPDQPGLGPQLELARVLLDRSHPEHRALSQLAVGDRRDPGGERRGGDVVEPHRPPPRNSKLQLRRQVGRPAQRPDAARVEVDLDLVADLVPAVGRERLQQPGRDGRVHLRLAW